MLAYTQQQLNIFSVPDMVAGVIQWAPIFLRGLCNLKHNHKQIGLSSVPAATQPPPRGIQRAESPTELKWCQETQTGKSPWFFLCIRGNHSSLHVNKVYWVTSILHDCVAGVYLYQRRWRYESWRDRSACKFTADILYWSKPETFHFYLSAWPFWKPKKGKLFAGTSVTGLSCLKSCWHANIQGKLPQWNSKKWVSMKLHNYSYRRDCRAKSSQLSINPKQSITWCSWTSKCCHFQINFSSQHCESMLKITNGGQWTSKWVSSSLGYHPHPSLTAFV